MVAAGRRLNEDVAMDRVAGGRRGQWVAVWTARATTEQRQQGGNGNKEAVATRMQWQQGGGGNMGAGNRAARRQWKNGRSGNKGADAEVD
jgi:hypothetical protein